MSMLSEQVKELKELAEGKIHYCEWKKDKILKQAADTIEELSAKLAKANMERSAEDCGGGWIVCDDRFPPIFKDVLIFTEEKEFYVAKIDEKEWILYDGTIIKTENVVAWQPLPEPYNP